MFLFNVLSFISMCVTCRVVTFYDRIISIFHKKNQNPIFIVKKWCAYHQDDAEQKRWLHSKSIFCNKIYMPFKWINFFVGCKIHLSKRYKNLKEKFSWLRLYTFLFPKNNFKLGKWSINNILSLTIYLMYLSTCSILKLTKKWSVL